MIDSLLFLYLAAFPLMGSPGPATLSLAAVGSTYGIKKGLRYYAGIVLGTFSVLLMIATGLTGILLAEPRLAMAITVIAAAYILYLAFKIATAPVNANETAMQQAPAFTGGFLLAIANPKAFTAIGAVYSSRTLIANDVLLDNIGKIAALSLVIVVVNGIWLLVGKLFSASLKNPKIAKGVNRVFALLLVISVGAALFSM